MIFLPIIVAYTSWVYRVLWGKVDERGDPRRKRPRLLNRKGKISMWYFAWMLGLPLAAAFAVLNAMWYELMDDAARAKHEGKPFKADTLLHEAYVIRAD